MTPPDEPMITRHFVTVGKRRVHYTRAGTGPAVVLLHASPCSAKVLAEPQRVFARCFTAIAMDTPGFGLSDPLPMAQPKTEDFADALADTLDALGIAQCAVHGRHTGAQVAVEFAARHPSRCAMAITDGFPVFTEDVKRGRPGQYLKAVEPAWDGSHLLWLWFRYREQHVFWPWNAQDLAHRADTDMPDLDYLHRGVVEFLEAGDGYRVGYATAYRHRGIDAIPDLRVPVCFGWRPGDSLHFMRGRMPENSWNMEFPREMREAAGRELEVLLQHPATAVVPPPPACAPIEGRTTTDYVDVAGRQVLVRRAGGPGTVTGTTPLVMLHALPGSSQLLDGLMLSLAGPTRQVLAFDLPGHGESAPLPGNPQDIASLANAALTTLDALGITACDVYAHQGGSAVAAELALLAPGRVRRLVLDAPPCLAPERQAQLVQAWFAGLQSFAPRWDGGHLVQAWHMRRDMALWWPWFDRRRETARADAPAIDPVALTAELREAMKQPHSYGPALRAVLGYPMAARLKALLAAPLLVAREDDAWAPCLDEAARSRSDAGVTRISSGDELVAWLRDALSSAPR